MRDAFQQKSTNAGHRRSPSRCRHRMAQIESPRIHRLPESLVRKIAAGEVIERPASVIKELVENGLDAGARRIRIDVIDGGRQKMRVVDDGRGMDRMDVELSVERHATSKMSSPTDLFTIGTLGFRGEALASIAAVSRLAIETRTSSDDEGTRIVIEGGVRREFGATAHDVGTAVEVQNLFFNTPARRKFLRHSDTEMRYLTQAVVQLAAAYPDVAFRLTHGDREILDLVAGERRERAAELLNADADELLWVEKSGGEEDIRLEGFITPPGLCRRSRAKQFLIVRQRPIQSRPLVSSLYAGYGSLLPPNAHPQHVLWLDLDPRHLDVNVHPTKREVRFAREREVRQVVQGVALEIGHPGRLVGDHQTALPVGVLRRHTGGAQIVMAAFGLHAAQRQHERPGRVAPVGAQRQVGGHGVGAVHLAAGRQPDVRAQAGAHQSVAHQQQPFA
ncbi:MAG TPA: DNA mismatch repair endonuclease MutL, partial [Candidatus Handelsmanbacteria bacterium]|nr:DNA mismatch repair endonuclease MutL [Candidatus Handelsmanbacteria bacterium]